MPHATIRGKRSVKQARTSRHFSSSHISNTDKLFLFQFLDFNMSSHRPCTVSTGRPIILHCASYICRLARRVILKCICYVRLRAFCSSIYRDYLGCWAAAMQVNIVLCLVFRKVRASASASNALRCDAVEAYYVCRASASASNALCCRVRCFRENPCTGHKFDKTFEKYDP